MTEFWTEGYEWSSVDLECTVPPGHPTRLGRIVPRGEGAALLTIPDALDAGVIEVGEVDEWRRKLHESRAFLLPRTVRMAHVHSENAESIRRLEERLRARHTPRKAKR